RKGGPSRGLSARCVRFTGRQSFVNSGVSGRWDTNRTCTRRVWSLPPFVPQRSGPYTNTLDTAHSDGPKVRRSPPTFTGVGLNIGVRLRQRITLYSHRPAGRASSLRRRSVQCELRSLAQGERF